MGRCPSLHQYHHHHWIFFSLLGRQVWILVAEKKWKHCFTFILINLLNFLTEENVLKSKNMMICPVSCKNANFCGWRDGLETWLATPSWKRCLYVSKFMCSKRLFQDHLSCNTLCSFIKIRQFLYRINLQDIKLFLSNPQIQ